MLSGYHFIKDLGSGGFGKVILAEEELSSRKVAIKYLKNLSIDKSEDIIHEIKIISQFYHPNIITYHNAIQENGQIFFVMEYCEKGNLRNHIANKPLSHDESIQIILLIAKALKFVHDKGIVHHDIKPENILLDSNSNVKLADFGVANKKIFTKNYLPPNFEYDSIKDHASDRKLDIYALGITFIELLTGEHPYAFMSREAAIKKIENGDLGISNLPDWLQEVLLKAINLNEESRFQNMNEFIEAIETNNIPLIIDSKLIDAARIAKKLSMYLTMKKYYTISKEISKIDASLFQYPILLQPIGKYYLEIGAIQKAKYTFEKIKGVSHSIRTDKELGIINLAMGHYSKAIWLFKEHLTASPDDCEAYNLLLECYFKNKRYHAGIALCKKLKETFPKESCFLSNLYIIERIDSKHVEVIDYCYKHYNNEFVKYNMDIFINGEEFINSSNKVSLLDKIVFCHYGVSKSKNVNSNLEIIYKETSVLLGESGFITIGRNGYRNQIELSGNNVSRRHCLILSFVNETWLYDLNSTGTFVDGVKVTGRMRLTHKHEVSIGNHVLMVNVDKHKLF